MGLVLCSIDRTVPKASLAVNIFGRLCIYKKPCKAVVRTTRSTCFSLTQLEIDPCRYESVVVSCGGYASGWFRVVARIHLRRSREPFHVFPGGYELSLLVLTIHFTVYIQLWNNAFSNQISLSLWLMFGFGERSGHLVKSFGRLISFCYSASGYEWRIHRPASATVTLVLS